LSKRTAEQTAWMVPQIDHNMDRGKKEREAEWSQVCALEGTKRAKGEKGGNGDFQRNHNILIARKKNKKRGGGEKGGGGWTSRGEEPRRLGSRKPKKGEGPVGPFRGSRRPYETGGPGSKGGTENRQSSVCKKFFLTSHNPSSRPRKGWRGGGGRKQSGSRDALTLGTLLSRKKLGLE